MIPKYEEEPPPSCIHLTIHPHTKPHIRPSNHFIIQLTIYQTIQPSKHLSIYIYPTLHPFIDAINHLSIFHTITHVSINIPIYSYTHQTIHSHIHPSIFMHPSNYPPIHICMYAPIHPTIHISIYYSIYHSIQHPTIQLFNHHISILTSMYLISHAPSNYHPYIHPSVIFIITSTTIYSSNHLYIYSSFHSASI